MAFTKHPLLDFEFLPTKLEKYCIYFLTGCHLIRTKNCTNVGSCVVFLVHGTILQQWTSLLKNSASIEKRKNLACDCWRIVPATVEESSQWLLNNRASDRWRIIPAIIEELFQWLEESCQWLLEKLFQWLLMNRANGCWTVVPTVFFLFLTYFGKILTSFSCKFFNYYWLFQFRVTTE